MQKTIQSLIRAALATAAVCTLSVAALAQSTAPGPTAGSGSLSGNVSTSLQLTSDGSALVPSGGATGTNVAGTNGALDFTINFGEVSPENANSMVSASLPLKIRGNAAYVIQVSRTDSLGANAGDIAPSDIGIGFGSASAAGDNTLLAANALSLTYVGDFDNDPAAASISNGKPLFAQTLADIGSSATTVLSGARVSAGGVYDADNNAILIPVTFAIAPQYFTPTSSFSTTLSFSIGTP